MALKNFRKRKPVPGEKVIVVGAGKSGLAISKLLAQQESRVFLLEKNSAVITPPLLKELDALGINVIIGNHDQKHFRDASFVIPSPGIPISSIHDLICDRPVEIISEMEMAWRYLDNEPIIAVTGTSGKTTCASLAAAMLKSQGYKVFLGGNIGTPLSEYVMDSRKADALVLEISSFQLQGCNTFCPRVGILLNLSPNHLDYHQSYEEYKEAKFRLFRCQDENDLAILGADLEEESAKFKISARKIVINNYDRFPNIRLFGRHNAINAEAAWQAVKFFGVSETNATNAVNNFLPLQHRLENVAEINNVLYVNDSKSTTVASLEAALRSFERPIHLLCGGKFKGGNLKSLTPLLKQKVRDVLLFGASREIFEESWKNVVPLSWHSSLQEAVLSAASNAVSGDVVLLSPATSSFDLYKNYKERGDHFKRIVSGLE